MCAQHHDLPFPLRSLCIRCIQTSNLLHIHVVSIFVHIDCLLGLLSLRLPPVTSIPCMMPTTEVTLILSDWTKGNNGKKLELPHVSMDATILDVKKSVLEALEAPDLQPETILLLVGTLELRNEKLLKDYNRSGRSKLSIDVYERVDMHLKVKTLQRK